MPRGSLTNSACGACFVLVAVLLVPSASAQAPAPAGEAELAAVMERLSIALPPGVASHGSVRRVLETLARERCDSKAIAELGSGLERLGYRREAAKAHVGFSEACGGQPESLRRAANILADLNDYKAMVKVTDDLIKLEPFGDNGYYLRAVARDRSGQARAAIDDYLTAIELFPNKQQIANVSYVAMAANHAKLGQYCDAATAINSWVSLNPARNDTSQMRAIVGDYTTKGRCPTGAAAGEEVFPLARGGNVVKLQVTVNGVRGTFLLDTGATFVSLRQSFADKAKVAVDPDSSVRLHTANGIVSARRGRADTIQLRSLSAKDVAIVVQTDAKGTYGDGVDGLLGMSFLSHFKLSMDRQTLRVSRR
jgi:clan AA aspartic protease (TIGR02281 family)